MSAAALPAATGDLIEVVDLAHDGRGVARAAGKSVFVAGALPGERVRVRRRARHDEAELLEVIEAAPERIAAACSDYGRCGGCALQHLSSAGQLAARARELKAAFERIGRVTPLRELAPLAGPAWHYRRRARLGVRYLASQARVLVGFRERDSPRLAELAHCHVLAEPVASLLPALGELVGRLSLRERLPQIEVAVGDRVTALVLRVLAAPSDEDRECLREFARQNAGARLEFWLQPGNAATLEPLDPAPTPLSYRLDEFDLTLEFGPLDFVQVNAALNTQLVARAVELMQLRPEHAVLDLYCGIGNFTLPLARRAGRVLGVEGEAGLVARARANARANGLAHAAFAQADLTGDPRAFPWGRERYARVLLDPPRAGAGAMLALLAACGAERVVYISCHAGSLARDAGELVHQHGFTLVAAGVMDMFPQTAHFESLAVFERRA